LDITDETRFENAFPAARELFELADEDDTRKWFVDLPAQRPDDLLQLGERRFLVVAYMLSRRSKPSAEIRRRLRVWRRHLPDLDEACRILAKARTRRWNGRFRPARTARQWKRLHGLVEQLIAVVERVFGSAPSQERPTPPRGLAPRELVEAIAKLAQTAQGVPAEASQPPRLPATCLLTDWEDVLSAAGDGPPQARVGGRQKSTSSRFRDRILPTEGSIRFPDESFSCLRAAFRKSVRYLRRGPSLVREFDFARGSHLGRLERVATDGRCFSRIRFEEGDGETSVAVLLDTSSSMEDVLDAYAAAAAALCHALDEAGFGCAAWTFDSAARRVEITSLRHVGASGLTATAEAMCEARQWLESRTDQRQAMMILTDGQPTDPEAAREEMRLVHARRIDLLVGAIGDGTRLLCERLFTRAVVFDCSAQWGGPSLLAAVRRLTRKEMAS
jgi:hypothetical protein